MSSNRSGIAPALLVAIGVLVGGNAALADGGKGRPPAHSPAATAWSGFYVGAGVGSAWGEATFDFLAPLNPPLLNDLDSALAGGLHVGYQRQWGRVVAGIEGSALFTDLSGASLCPLNPNFTCAVDVEWVLMLGPRLGLAADNLHFYGTGGFAVGSLETRTITNATGAVFDRGDGQHTGWYLGAGVEWSLSRALVLGVEYRHIDLGTDTHVSSFPIPGGNRDVEATLDTVQARLTLKLGD